MKWLRLTVVVLLLAGSAHAGDKLAWLDAKAHATRPKKAERLRVAKQLARLVGKLPPALINVHNNWTSETLVFDAKPEASVTQDTWDLFLRCHFTNQTHHMEKRLTSVLLSAARRFRVSRIDIVSGFRSPKYNLLLRKKGHEVARQSQHTEGNAVDFRLPGVTTRKLLKFVKSLHLGGVGFYAESAFVHADTGPIRYWAGR